MSVAWRSVVGSIEHIPSCSRADNLAACFNVASGDVEDAPAPDPLHKFDVIEKDGAVYIKGQEADIKAGRRQPKVKCSVAGEESVIIVGG